MDKLELDARMDRLERRVSFLSAVTLGFLTLIGLGLAAFLVRVGRTEARPHPPVMATPAPAVPMPMLSPFPVDLGEGGVSVLCQRLQELADVRTRELITDSEFEAKKERLLAAPLQSGNLGSDLEQIGDLVNRQVITPAEHQALKAKILQIGDHATVPADSPKEH